MLRKSTLDALLPQLTRFRCVLGGESRQKLEQHEAAVRSIERQIDAAITARTGEAGGAMPTIDRAAAAESFYLPAGNRWGNYPALARMQLDTTVAAFAADSTRVVALQFNKSNGRVVHSWLDLVNKGNVWHELSHNSVSARAAVGNDRALVARWYAQQLAYLIKRLKETPEGDGTMLDNTLVLHVSEMGAGNHSPNDIPFLLAGRGGGAFRTGLFVDARKGGARRYNNDLLAAVARGFGVPVEWFGVRNRSGSGRFSEGILRSVLTPGVL